MPPMQWRNKKAMGKAGTADAARDWRPNAPIPDDGVLYESFVSDVYDTLAAEPRDPGAFHDRATTAARPYVDAYNAEWSRLDRAYEARAERVGPDRAWAEAWARIDAAAKKRASPKPNAALTRARRRK